MKKYIYRISLLLTWMVVLVSCEKEYNVQFSTVDIALKVPTGIQNYELEDITLIFKEANSGIVTNATIDGAGKLNKNLPSGSYSVSLEGKIEYVQDNNTINNKIKSYKDGITISSGEPIKLDLDLFIRDEKAGFIFKEIFFTGTQTPENKAYNGDKYFIIYNNSDDTLYADGLIVAQSTFLTTTKRDYKPNVMNEAFTTNDLFMIPGTGKEYPVLPGKQIIIANNAINHLEYNSNSINLQKADFEIELLSSINIDNPAVKNTISISGSMTMHNRGFTSYILAKLPEGTTVNDFKRNNLYTYSYLSGTREISANGYKMSNSFILDAVNLTVPAKFEWIVTSPQLDMGWTYCGKVDADATRYGKTVLRKILTTNPDGRIIYQDTNNSTVDFIPESKPSIL